MSDKEWLSADPQSLVDVSEVQINPKLHGKERTEDYLQKVGNPCLYRVGDVVVKSTYAERGSTLNEQLRKYILSV